VIRNGGEKKDWVHEVAKEGNKKTDQTAWIVQQKCHIPKGAMKPLKKISTSQGGQEGGEIPLGEGRKGKHPSPQQQEENDEFEGERVGI